MRGRLIEVLKSNSCSFYECPDNNCIDCEHYALFNDDVDKIADTILADGWMRPPCRVGDTVYRISTRRGTGLKYIQKTTISRIAQDSEGIWLFCACNPIARCVFGKTVFLSREEAEKALKGKEDEEE